MSTSDGATWRSLNGETLKELFVGAHVIDPSTGTRGQVVEVLGPREALVQLPDGSVVRAASLA